MLLADAKQMHYYCVILLIDLKHTHYHFKINDSRALSNKAN